MPRATPSNNNTDTGIVSPSLRALLCFEDLTPDLQIPEYCCTQFTEEETRALGVQLLIQASLQLGLLQLTEAPDWMEAIFHWRTC